MSAFVVLVLAVVAALLFVGSGPERTSSRGGRASSRSRASEASSSGCMPHEGLERLELRRSDDELASYVADLYRKKAEYFVLELASRERLAVGYTSGEKWLDVVTRKRRRGERGGVFTGPYESFGYNCDAGRWSYGEDPPGAGEIRALLAKHFGAKESGRWS